ncbi:dipeptidyl peptidase 3 [Flavobacterium sp. CBA20B-1]|uniref:dipeptidyl peptidase 3 n=1 Tax=unclassified Flavobacterium TaxID=196869 RepID=UPI0022259414|nr:MULTISPECIES: dipeptidyl peptidase 3 [unclassified Flavobacterium]WCM40886.1 dipeptidyl peptidase 3 [Flavobacterium sp. CBA20B-1]
MKFNQFALIALAVASITACNKEDKMQHETRRIDSLKNIQFQPEQFADVQVLKYDIPGWEKLTLKEKKLVYYLAQAGYSGRDIFWDQNYKYNLKIRTALENIYTNYKGDRSSENWKKFETYLKRIWFSNGIHHHYSNDKIKPGFPQTYLQKLLKDTKTNLSASIVEILFNDVDAKKVNLNESKGLVQGSAVNFYGKGLNAADVEKFYANMPQPDSLRPLSFGLNSKLVRTESGKIEERIWRSGGMYGAAIDKIVFWLEKAVKVSENKEQAEALNILIDFYKTGDLKKWDDYNVAWVKATEGNIDYINGFIEVYNDPLGHKASYESTVQIKDFDMSAKMEVISKSAQWFEDNSPLMPEHKKKNVVGVSYKTVIVAAESGDTSPATPIGVNLPNADWIRAEHGSKSISLGNIIEAYNKAGGSDKLKEFAFDENEIQLSERYSELADKLHTALHEVIGHASGQLNPGVGTPKETLKSYASTLEEGRADLVALYYLYDQKIQDLGLVDDWKSLGMAAYNDYIRNGLMTQLVRIEPGSDIEEAHMRNRQWVSAWVYEKGKAENVIEKVVRDNKTYFKINNYERLHELFGELLRETQRIKSEGDFKAAKSLVENYGVKVDKQLHKEVLERNKKFNTAPYRGFVNPILVPVTNEQGEITDIVITYPKTFAEQMLYYSKNYNFLPLEN